MTVNLYKHTNKKFIDTFTKPKRTKEVGVYIENGISVLITEHQFGNSLDKPQITIITNLRTYGMDFDEFIKKINS